MCIRWEHHLHKHYMQVSKLLLRKTCQQFAHCTWQPVLKFHSRQSEQQQKQLQNVWLNETWSCLKTEPEEPWQFFSQTVGQTNLCGSSFFNCTTVDFTVQLQLQKTDDAKWSRTCSGRATLKRWNFAHNEVKVKISLLDYFSFQTHFCQEEVTVMFSTTLS